MKNENDLLIDFHEWLFVEALGNPAKGRLIFNEWKKAWIPKLKQPAAALSEDAYNDQLGMMKEEAPGYLHFLRSNGFPDLPPDLQPFPKN